MSETEQNQKWECTKKYNYNNFDFWVFAVRRWNSIHSDNDIPFMFET